MAVFRYQAVDGTGRRMAGHQEAATRNAAIDALEIQKLFVVKIEEAGEERIAPWRRLTGFLPIASSMDIVLFCRRLATLVASDIPLLESLGAIANQVENPGFRGVLEEVKEQVRQGKSFSEAMSRHPRVFPELMVSMVRVGETGGILALILEELAELMERDNEVRTEVRAALAYPLLVLVLAMGTVVFLLWRVVPRLASIFESMRVALPLPTRILMGSSHVLSNYGIYLLLVLGLAIVGWFRLLRKQRVRDGVDRFKMRVPLVGSLMRKVMIARFARSLGALVHGGVPLMEGLRVVSNVLDNATLRNSVERVMDGVRRGETLTRSIQREDLFPEMVKYMISAGEDSGRLDQMLLKIADVYEMESRQAIKVFVNLMAPLLILIVAAVVGFIAFAMLLPIFQINQMIG